jgi:Pentapeptide repeats (8 copies)
VIKRGTALWIAAGVVAVVLAVFFGWVLFVPAADWLARHDVGNATGASVETARNNARGNLLALTAGLAGFGALLFTARNFTLQRRSLQLAEEGQRRAEEGQRRAEEGQRRTLELTEQGQVTDRYTKAIEQLGSDKLDVRIGGIYALERIARDSERDHPTVIEVLTAFIREHSREPWPEPNPQGETAERPTRGDVQAAIDVVCRRDIARDIRQVDLRGADLEEATVNRASLSEADLAEVILARAHLPAADFRNANLEDADLGGATLTNADLRNANLRSATLTNADLTNADLGGATLTMADLRSADLRNANLEDADLTIADLTNADLRNANLRGADLTDAKYPGEAPEGWLRDSSSGRLRPAPGV